MKDENGLGTLEMLLILAIIVVIAIAFRKWISNWVNALFDRANDGIDNVTNIEPGTDTPIDPSISTP
jgi:Flp pilus assembly pilin Flp